MVTEQFPYFAGMTHKRLPSFGDETLILLLILLLTFLNDLLFIVCLFELCLQVLHFDPRFCLSLSIFVVIYSVACLTKSYLHGGLNRALIYRVHTICVSFPDCKWHDASKPGAQFSPARRFWTIQE